MLDDSLRAPTYRDDLTILNTHFLLLVLSFCCVLTPLSLKLLCSPALKLLCYMPIHRERGFEDIPQVACCTCQVAFSKSFA